jgi:Mg2+-importing ATPase
MTEQTAGPASQGHVGVDEDTRLRELAGLPVFSVFQQVASSPRGLTEQEAADRLRRFGDNESFRNPEDGLGARVAAPLRSPFVALLAGLDAVFVAVGDAGGAITVAVMVILAVLLRIWQQTRSVRATRALGELVTSTATVRRRADADDEPVNREVPLEDLVPGDIVVLRTGDVVPADLRILSSTDLVVDQSVLSGESLPVSKTHTPAGPARQGHPLVDAPSQCFSGTAVVAGAATAVVVATGTRTYFGSLARGASRVRAESSFDRGVRTVGWTLVRFMLVLSPVVFVISGVVSGVWARAAMFAVAVAVGLTPEMLPVIAWGAASPSRGCSGSRGRGDRIVTAAQPAGGGIAHGCAAGRVSALAACGYFCVRLLRPCPEKALPATPPSLALSATSATM